MRNILEWTGIIGGLALAYPLIDPLTQSLGFTLGFVALILIGSLPAWITFALGHLWDTWAAQRTCHPSEAARLRDEARQEALTVPAGQTLH